MKRWNIRPTDPILQIKLSKDLGISNILSQLLINRNIDTARHAKMFLDGESLELYDPYLMKGMKEAVSRIKAAIDKKEKILIHGDYDVDGVTSITLLMFTLRNLGLDPIYYIPHRMTEGYGLSDGGVLEAIKEKVGLVITVDCGITSIEEVKMLNSHNIDVIITDHHEVGKELPKACAIINPHQKTCMYPDKDLSGVSVVFKLCDAINSVYHVRENWKHLDLVALGTISDVAPLVGENRILVKEGLKILKSGTTNTGLKALIETSGIKKNSVDSYKVAFILGPRINAAGRVGKADNAVELLITDNEKRALFLAKELNEANRERQRIGNATLKEALTKVDREVNFKEHKIIVLDSEDWHTGVIGIVASRISDRFYRPCIMISRSEGLGKGSGRSIEGFHLFDALTDCKDVLKEYGGHKYACGLTILEENLASFRETINEIAKRSLNVEDLVPSIDIEMEIELDLIDNNVVDELERLEPFGEGNPRPIFCSKNISLASSPRIIKGDHIKFRVKDKEKDLEAIGFGLVKDTDIEDILAKNRLFDLCYTISFNEWQGFKNIQLTIEDIRPSGSFQP
ncbi:MAG: single-stranded-DNA-specific exonuclease RecJ [Candidatus Omnitrophota bacterium]